MTRDAQILILDANPDPDSLCAALATRYARGAQRHTSAQVLRLGELEFDPILRRGNKAEQPWEPDLERAARAIQAARHIVLIFPTWWAAPPALLKGFIDRVFLPGWAYKFEGGALPTPLLAGRTGRVVTTMDSPAFWYKLMQGSAVHAALIRPTLHFVGIKPVQRTTLYKVRELDQATLDGWVTRLEQIGEQDGARVASAQSLRKNISSMV